MEKARILIVEDEAIIAMEIESQLQGLGYEVTSIVNTGEKAIEKAEADKPDLILMDIRIKGEMDGIETAEIIRNQFGIPVIFSTAYLDQERIDRAKLTMPFGYVLKPIQERDLRVTLEMALNISKVDGERRKMEENLKENSFFLNKAQEIGKLGHFSFDPVSGNVEGSTELFRIFDVDPTNPLFEAFGSAIHPDDGHLILPFIDRAVKDGISYDVEHRVRHRNGDELHVNAKGEILNTERGKRMVGIVQDITERKQTEKTLKRTEARYRMLIDQAADTILIHNFEGQILDSNERACENLGYSRKELLQMNIANIDVEANSFVHRKNYWGKLTPSQPVSFESRNKRKDGTLFPSETRLGLMVDEGNKTIVSIVRDITDRRHAGKKLQEAHDGLELKVAERTAALQQEIDERKQIEHDLLESRKEAEFANSAKSEFLSNLSHEFRTPMHQILSFSKFGVDKTGKVDNEKLLHYFSKIGTIGKNLLSLLNDLLDLSKLESGKMDYDMRKSDLKQVIHNVSNEFTSLANDKGVILDITENNIQTEMICDEGKIGQVIRNCISNAIKFTPKNKKITISIEHSELLKEYDKTVISLLVKVSDQGLGIPENELETVFDKFVQSSKTKTNSGGTGLGLAICKEIINAHNGKIWAENNLEGGATFSLMLPYEQETTSS
jgi:PAS domain S-box-containing protein